MTSAWGTACSATLEGSTLRYAPKTTMLVDAQSVRRHRINDAQDPFARQTAAMAARLVASLVPDLTIA
jgi:hypothetical protein